MTGDLNRLRYMGRFSTSHVHHRENVAEHSYYVVLYSFMICCHLQLTGYITEDDKGRQFVNEVMIKALLHDCEESVTGDMPRPFKYKHPGVRALLNQAATHEVRGIAKRLFPWERESELGPKKAHNNLWEGITKAWSASKENQTGAVVAFADFLSVLSHLMLEIEASNWTMRQHYECTLEYAETFRSSTYDFIRDLADEAIDLVKEIFSDATAKTT